jgi:hypothetical protein
MLRGPVALAGSRTSRDYSGRTTPRTTFHGLVFASGSEPQSALREEGADSVLPVPFPLGHRRKQPDAHFTQSIYAVEPPPVEDDGRSDAGGVPGTCVDVRKDCAVSLASFCSKAM